MRSDKQIIGTNHGSTSVSYTHLDVYKRQALERRVAGRQMGEALSALAQCGTPSFCNSMKYHEVLKRNLEHILNVARRDPWRSPAEGATET